MRWGRPMSDNSHVLRMSTIAATMSLVVLSCVTTTAQADHHLNRQPPVSCQSYVDGTFTPSTAMEVSVSGLSLAEAAGFGALVDDAYRSLAVNQRRLDPLMASVVADAVWDLYVTD